MIAPCAVSPLSSSPGLSRPPQRSEFSFQSSHREHVSCSSSTWTQSSAASQSWNVRSVFSAWRSPTTEHVRNSESLLSLVSSRVEEMTLKSSPPSLVSFACCIVPIALLVAAFLKIVPFSNSQLSNFNSRRRYSLKTLVLYIHWSHTRDSGESICF